MFEAFTVFLAGILTLATPCVLPLIPIYLAMLLGGTVDSLSAPSNRGRLLYMSAAFSAGFATVFTALGFGSSFLGGLLSDNREILSLLAAVFILIFGLKSLDLLKIAWLERDLRFHGTTQIKSGSNAFIFGLIFALGWTPCVGPVLGSVLSYTALSGSQLKGALLLMVYSSGLALPLLVIAGFADRLVPLLRRVSRHLPTLQRIAGISMVSIAVFIGVDAGMDLASKQENGPITALTTSSIVLDPLMGNPLEKPRMVELVEEQCSICQRMASRIEMLKEDCTDQLVDVHVVSLSDSQNRGLKRKLKVSGVPTILLIDDHGNIIDTSIGERSLEELRGMAANLQAMSCADEEPIIDLERLPKGPSCVSEGATGPEECG